MRLAKRSQLGLVQLTVVNASELFLFPTRLPTLRGMAGASGSERRKEQDSHAGRWPEQELSGHLDLGLDPGFAPYLL